MQRRHLLALPLAAAGGGCALKTVHLEEKNFLPDAPTPLIPEQIQRHNVQLQVDEGVLLRGWHLQHPEARALLLYFLGNGDNVLAYAGQLHEIAHSYRVDVLVLDYRGSGASGGAKRLANVRDDALRIHDELAAPLARRRGLPLLAWGYSMGSMPAIHLAAERPLAGLAVLAGFSDFPDVRAGLQERLVPWYARPFVRISWEPVFDTRPQPIDEITAVRVPLFLFHGEADAQLPVRCGDRLDAMATQARWKRYVRAPGVGHGRLPLFQGAAREGLEAWLAEALKG